MRFALIATAAAAAVAVPLAVQASGPRMSDDQFVSAVRCAAYDTVLASRAPETGTERMRLNAEAVRQSPEAVARAHNEVNAVSRRAATVANRDDAAMMRAERSAACSPSVVASAADTAA